MIVKRIWFRRNRDGCSNAQATIQVEVENGRLDPALGRAWKAWIYDAYYQEDKKTRYQILLWIIIILDLINWILK